MMLRRMTTLEMMSLNCFCDRTLCYEIVPKLGAKRKITNGGGGVTKVQRKKKNNTSHSARSFSNPLLLPLTHIHTHTHKHIGTNTYTSKQRCHFTQEGSAVLSIRQGLVLGQRLLPNLRPPSPGSTGPLWPPSGSHHPRRQAPHCSCTTNKWQFSCSDKL